MEGCQRHPLPTLPLKGKRLYTQHNNSPDSLEGGRQTGETGQRG
jgi:hypothetical protein